MANDDVVLVRHGLTLAEVVARLAKVEPVAGIPVVPRKLRIVPERDELGEVVLMTREWIYNALPSFREDDDALLLIDPDCDPRDVGRFVNQLRDMGHSVEIAWPKRC